MTRQSWCGLAALCLLVAASGWPRPADAARVLAIETVAAKSHWNFMRGVLHALADHGHLVKVYTPFPDPGRPATVGYTEVDTSAEFRGDHTDATTTAVNMDASVVPLFARPSFMLPFIANGSRRVCDTMNRLLQPDVGAYDIFVTEPLSSECVSHAARQLGVPLVYVVPAPLLPWIETGAFGHYANPAVVPHLFSAYAVPSTFYQRLQNVAMHLHTVYVNYRYTSTAAAAEQRPYDLAPPVKPALVFVNTHYVTEPSRPVPLNRVDVGGIHLTAPQQLPADILKFIEESPNGVIFFTFGTVVALSTLPDHIQIAFKNALAEVPQRVLLKYEGEMTDKPKNVMTSKWLPQRDILMHPNVKLFIGHGGISGVYEAVDAGVPVLGFPLFYDQPRNVANLVDAGMALSMDLFSVTKDTLLNAINEIINNETYSKNAKITSELFKDRPMSPAESVVYWTEYVIRHKGAPHLKSHALNLTWYQYFLLDVIAVALLLIISVCYIVFKTLQLIKKLIFKSSSKSKSKPD
ncbi:UDP-glucuronosyltransferase 1-5-like isoform X2 [Myzus persicae]|uniref:UDP-glucuronosyltransferase n=1 Tax=Myzus persicae TaxID=13164 RepID=A0A2D1GSM8_MYZPE|nr:UDP-glucuronosyltransferase 1-5-like isoform X2 [Myzus persicae]ATN96068.1 UDP-glucuronosyl transferase 344F5 [Myzus persicae]